MSDRGILMLPYRLEPEGIGWSLAAFETAAEAAVWFQANQHRAMPSWRRMAVVEGRLALR